MSVDVQDKTGSCEAHAEEVGDSILMRLAFFGGCLLIFFIE